MYVRSIMKSLYLAVKRSLATNSRGVFSTRLLVVIKSRFIPTLSLANHNLSSLNKPGPYPSIFIGKSTAVLTELPDI